MTLSILIGTTPSMLVPEPAPGTPPTAAPAGDGSSPSPLGWEPAAGGPVPDGVEKQSPGVATPSMLVPEPAPRTPPRGS